MFSITVVCWKLIIKVIYRNFIETINMVFEKLQWINVIVTYPLKN